MPNNFHEFIDRREMFALGGTYGLLAATPQAGTQAPQQHYGEPIRLSQMGARARTFADETAVVQAAINLAIASQRPLMIDIATRVSTLYVRRANGLFIFQSAPIVGLRSGTFPTLLLIEDSHDISWAGRMWLSCQWNTGYGAAVTFSTKSTNMTSNITIQDWSITGARTAFRFGTPDSRNGAVSEVSVLGGFSYGCPNVVEAYGTETVVSFNGANLIANNLGGKGNWSDIPSDAVRVFGAHLSISGGEVQHNTSPDGSAFVMQPYAAPNKQAQFGSIVAMGVAIESAGPLLTINDLPGTDVNPDSGHFFIEGCYGYHSQRTVPFITIGKQYGGRVRIGNGCNFRAGAQRTVPIVRAAGRARLDVPDDAFNQLFHPPK